ncbi:MAG: hypothetical protein GWN55_06880 [Phycisphaerae bacterium]|nr:hypothetical protein [Phycisphaerae bacterium]NIU25705.1 hypothetical protein [candidate division KSB1 bacterium]NIP55090.1 hypothetical protein [Phycisphaerae bacterium]NIS52698.1 hypothetical protein [Phycisphaerae bacterium]NIV01034.1 hypothetical protein [Phycisphaerae bacterium]
MSHDDCTEFYQLVELLDDRWNDSEVSDVRFGVAGECDLSDLDDNDDSRTDDYGEDYRIEVALDECPFDYDELSDNMLDSGPEF